MTKMKQMMALALVAAMVLPALSACGKKGDLDPPPSAPKERTYPKPQ
jgi:predicted small lipoprotein YifL